MKKDKNNKNILFLSRLYYPHIGGVERHVAKISEILIKKGHNVTVVCEQHDRKLKIKEQINGINVLRIPINSTERNKKFHIWKWMVKNRKFIKSFDIVHIHDIFYWIFPLLVYFDRKKIFITFHGYESYPIKTSSKIQKKIAAKYCSGSICVGEFINKWYEITSNAVIYGGVNDPIVPKKLHKSLKNSLNILYIGRLSDDMGAKTYIEVLGRLKNKGTKLNLQVCGDGKYRNEFEKLGKVEGFVKKIDFYIAKSDIVLSSSYLTMLEVLFLKKPIYAVYSNPLKEDYLKLSPFSKFISINSSQDELYKNIKKGFDRKTLEAGQKWAKKQSWENVFKTYKTIWKI